MNTVKTGDWYDEDYWENSIKGGKSGFTGAYTWERLSKYFQGTAGWIKESFQPRTSMDVGCAKGYLVAALRELGVEAYGTDFSPYAIKNSHPDSHKYLELCDITQKIPLKFKPNFSLVTCFDVMEHIDEYYVEGVIRKLAYMANSYVIFNIGLNYEGYDDTVELDKSHCTVYFRDWWEEKIKKQCPDFTVLPEGSYFNKDVWWFNVLKSLIILKRRQDA